MSVFSKKKKKDFYSFPKNLLLPSCSGRLSSPSFSITQKTNSLLVHLLRERENPSFNNCLLDGLHILTDLWSMLYSKHCSQPVMLCCSLPSKQGVSESLEGIKKEIKKGIQSTVEEGDLNIQWFKPVILRETWDRAEFTELLVVQK